VRGQAGTERAGLFDGLSKILDQASKGDHQALIAKEKVSPIIFKFADSITR